MQKLQRTFVESKMNKDLDNRFVPAGEYRDAENISVITNTDSSSGAVQNSKGNTAVSELSRNTEASAIVNGATTTSTIVNITEANDLLKPGMFLTSNSAQPNLLTNGDFATSTTGWTLHGQSGGAHGFIWVDDDKYHSGGGGTTGGYLYRGVNGGTNSRISQNVTVEANQTYIFSYRKKSTGGSAVGFDKTSLFVDLALGSSYQTYGATYDSSGQWVNRSVEITPTASGTLNFMFYMHADGEGYVDDVVLKKKQSQPIITAISDDGKTIYINEPISFADAEVLYFQYSKMLPNECVGSIEDETEGSIYWLTSSRDNDESRQFNFRNMEQRSNVNLVTNGNFQLGTLSGLYTRNFDWHRDDITVTNDNTDDYVTVESKTGSTAKYPRFYSLGIRFEHGRTYKVNYDVATMTYAGGTDTPKIYLMGSDDRETGVEGVVGYRPVYDTGGYDAGEREFKFVFDNRYNNGSNYMRFNIELTQPAGGYNGSSSLKLVKLGKLEITEVDADACVYQDTIFEYKDNKTNVVCNDIYMLEMSSSSPMFTGSANTTTTDATVIHDAVTEDMFWDIVAKGDNDDGVPHIPFNPLTHAGKVKKVQSPELIKDNYFTDSDWSNGSIPATGQANTYWNDNNTGVTGTGTGAIHHLNNTTVFNTVAADKSLTQKYGTPIKGGREYTVTISGTITAGGIRVLLFGEGGTYAKTPTVESSWSGNTWQFHIKEGDWLTGGNLKKSVSIKTKGSGTTSATINYISVRDTHSLNEAILEPYTGTEVQFPTDATAYKLRLFKPKALNFNAEAKITGINIVDKMLFWTDGYSEPKKINIENYRLGTKNIYSQTRVHAPDNHTMIRRQSFVDDNTTPPVWAAVGDQNANNKSIIIGGVTYNEMTARGGGYTFDKWGDGYSSSISKMSDTDTAVIRQAPIQPPTLQKFDSASTASSRVPYIKFTKDLHAAGLGGHAATSLRKLMEGQILTIIVTPETARHLSSVSPGDTLYVCNDSAVVNFSNPDLKLQVTRWDSPSTTTRIYTTVLWINPNPIGDFNSSVPYTAVKYDSNSLYNDKFVRFAYRYKYQDGEYSTFSPWSHPAFMPGTYFYEAEKGINLGMLNKLKSLIVKGWNRPDKPADVVAIDLLYKDSTHTNVYKVNTFTKSDTEFNSIAYDSTTINMRHRGMYIISNENLQGALPESQLLRSWDSVPKTAVAQEIIGNRLVYANYTQGYDLETNGVDISFELAATIGETSTAGVNPGDLAGVASCKSLRTYQVGVVYGDEFGRETPILTHTDGAVTASTVPGSSRLLLQAQVKSNAPSWAKYYKYYVKESSADYHNLVLDRWYENDDDTVWLSFLSHDVNKLMKGDEIVLKKKHGSDYVITNAVPTKVLAIEEAAPEITKLSRKKLAIYDAQKVGTTLRGVNYGDTVSSVDNGTHQEHYGLYGTHITNASLPDRIHNGNINPGDDYIDFTVDGWEASELLGIEQNFWNLNSNEKLVVYVQRWGLTSEKYTVVNIQSPATAAGATSTLFDDKYRITLERQMGQDVEFVKTGRYDLSSGVYNGLVIRSFIELEFYVESYEVKDEHEGRFFVKVEKTSDVRKYVMCAGRDIETREIMEVRLPYLAHNANYWSDGTTGISTSDPRYVPFTDSSDGNYNGSQKSAVDYHLHNHHGSSLDSVTENRQKQARINESGNGPLGAYSGGYSTLNTTWLQNNTTELAQMYDNNGNLGASNSTICEGSNMRGPTDWEDYCTRWGNSADTGNEAEFLFVDKEPRAACYNYWWQGPIKEGVDQDPTSPTYQQWIGGVAFDTTDPYFQGGNWEPIYSMDDGSGGQTTNIPYNYIYDPATDVRPGVANGWIDNSPWKYHYPTTKSGGIRTYNYPDQSWYASAMASTALDSRKSGHRYRAFDGRDKNNSPGYQGLSSAIPWGCDGGEPYLGIGRVGPGNSMRIKQFTWRVYTQVTGWDPENEAPGVLEGRSTTQTPQKFYWKEDPDKEIYSIVKSTYNRHFKNYDLQDNGMHTGYATEAKNRGYSICLYLDKPNGSGPSGWLPFYHAQTNPSGAIDSGTGWAQPWYNVTNGEAAVVGALGASPCPEYRTIVLIEDTVSSTKSESVESPAVFETIPPKEQELDIYWEAGGALPIEVDGNNGYSLLPYISTNSIVEIDYYNTVDQTATGGPAVGPATQELTLIDIAENGKLIFDGSIETDVAVNDIIRVFKPDSEKIDYTSFTIAIDPGTGNNLYINDAVHGGWNSIPFINCINFQNGVESRSIKDAFTGEQISNGVVASTTIDTIPKEEKYENSLIYSGIYNSKTGMNDFNQFIIGNNITKDINPEYGSIQKLNTRDADMTVLCEHKVIKMLVNKNSLYNADGSTNVTASDLVLGQDVPYVGEYGISKNPESFVSHGYKAFFTDRNRGAVLRLSQDGLTTISKNGMESWFDVNLRGDGFVIGTYDTKKYEYNLSITLPEIKEDVNFNNEYTRTLEMSNSNSKIEVGMYVTGTNVQPGATVESVNGAVVVIDKDTLTGGALGTLTFASKKTISFNDVSNGWSSFRSFIPEEGLSVRGEYFTYKDGVLFQHYTNDKANYYYGKPYTSSITAVFNDGPEVVKDFKTLEYLGSLPKNLPTEYGWYISAASTDLETGYVGSFKEKETKWFGYVKGFDSGYTDPKQFTTQGIGAITKIETV